MEFTRRSSGRFSKFFNTNPENTADGHNKASGSTSLELQVPSLGRSVSVGSLYNTQTDQFNATVRLWSQDSINNMMAIHSCPKVPTIRIEKATSFTERANLLGLTPSLRLNLLSGDIIVEGSGLLLHDSRTSLTSVTITLEFTQLTRVKQLNVGSAVDHPSNLKSTSDTHVVSGIQYGAKAFFTFELDVKELEDPAEAMRTLEIAVGYLKNTLQEPNSNPPSYNAEDVHEEMTHFPAIRCRYFGDFNLDPLPLTLSDVFRCIDVVTNGNVEVPLEVFLTPLSQFGGKPSLPLPAPKIAPELIDDVGNYSHFLKDAICTTKAKVSKLTQTPWQATLETLTEFLTSVETHEKSFSQALSKLLPQARESRKGCEKLSKLLSGYRDDSPFSAQLLQDWVSSREKECNTLMSYFNALEAEGTKLYNFDIQQMNTKDYSGFLAGIKDLFLSSDADATNFENANVLFMTFKFPVSSYPQSLKTFLKDEKKFIRAADSGISSWIGSCEHTQATEIVSELVQILRRNSSEKFSSYVRVAVASGSSGQSDGLIQVNKLCKKGQYWCPWKPPSQPDKLSCVNVTDTVAELSWSQVSEFATSVQYKVEIFRTDVADTQPFWSEITDSPSAKAVDLCPDAEFDARVSAVTPFGNSKPSENLKFRTLPLIVFPCSEFVKTNWCLSTPLAKQKGEEFPGEIYQINKRAVKPHERCTCSQDACICPMSFEIGDSKQTIKPPKFLLIVGETGTGKSTFINGIANAFYKVKYKDNFRLKLIAEPEGKTHSAKSSDANQAHSQTSVVAVYTLFPVNTGGTDSKCRSGMDCPLTIIDTPGFGDTQGLEEDKNVVRKISKVLGGDGSSIPGMTGLLHAIGFVVKASQNRLTYPQKYIFDQVLSLFGKNLEQLILPVLTFADSSEPQALAALREDKVPHDKYLKFNNGMLYADNTLVDNIKSLAKMTKKDKLMLEIKLNANFLNWNQGNLYYLELFEVISNIKEGVSLQNTRDVLKSRKTLETCMEGLMVHVKKGISVLTLLEENLNLIESLDIVIKDSDARKTRKVKVPRLKKTPVTNGRFVTLCMTCSKTCHYDCAYQNDTDKKKCSAMDSTGHCTVCPKNCMWNQHFNRDFFFEDYEEYEVVTVQEIADKYQVNMKDRDAKKQLIEGLLHDFEKEHNDLTYHLVTIHKCLQTLDQMALRQYPLSVVEYVDNLIKVQEDERQPGWKNRVKYLRDARESAKIVAKARDGQDPFGEMREKVLERCKKALADELRKTPGMFQRMSQLVGSTWHSLTAKMDAEKGSK